MSKVLTQALEYSKRIQLSHEDLLGELKAIVAGWQAIQAGAVRGRTLTAWEQERLRFAKEAIAQAKDTVK